MPRYSKALLSIREAGACIAAIHMGRTNQPWRVRYLVDKGGLPMVMDFSTSSRLIEQNIEPTGEAESFRGRGMFHVG